MPEHAPEADSERWWDGVRSGELRYQSCLHCGTSVFYPRARCYRCFSDRLEWRTSSGRGTVYASTTVNRAPKAFASRAPYVVALVDLAEGFRMMSVIVECPPEEVCIGMAVDLVFQPDQDGRMLPCFQPTATDPPALQTDKPT